MAQLKLNLTLLVLFCISLMSNLDQVEPSLPKRAETMAYIKASCKNTLYQSLCIKTLSKFAKQMQDPQKLAQIAMSVSLSRAIHTRAYLLKLAIQINATTQNYNKRDFLVVQDCLSQINDSVDQLGQSIKELRRMNSLKTTTPINIDDRFLWHISNVETWVSTALTDASTCVESFPGHRMSKLKASIRVRALNVAQVTSNALALFHGYAAKYRAAAAAAAATINRKP